MSTKLYRLKQEYLALKAEFDAGARHLALRCRSAYSAWVRQSWKEGIQPDSLGQTRLTGDEYLRENSIPGAEHTYWRGGESVYLPEGRRRKVEIYVMEKHIGRKINDYNEIVEHGCEQKGCIRPAHLRIRPKLRTSISEAEAISMLREAARRLGRAPYAHEHRNGAPHARTVRSLFGGWAEGLAAAGLEPEPHHHPHPTHSEEAMLEALRTHAAELGRPPQAGEWEKNHWTPSYATIRKRFKDRGGFFGAMREAGVM